MLFQLLCLLTTLKKSYSAHQQGHWIGSKVEVNSNGMCTTTPDIGVTITATHYIIGPKDQNGTRYTYNANVRNTKNCDEVLDENTNPKWYITNYIDHTNDKNVMILSYDADAGNGCLPNVEPCVSNAANKVTRYQLCRLGFDCINVFPNTGLRVSGYGWFEGDAAGNFAYQDTNRVAAGIMTAITLGVLMVTVCVFRVLLTDKLVTCCQCLEAPALYWSATILGFIWWIVIIISCAAPYWSIKIGSGASLGLWLSCPDVGTCVDTLMGQNYEQASTGIIFSRLVSILSVFVAMPVFVLPAMIHIQQKEDLKKWIFTTVICSLTVASFQFTALVAWASFQNDVLIPQAEKLGYTVDYGYAFNLCWVCWIFGMIIGLILELIELKNRGQTSTFEAIQKNVNGGNDEEEESQLPSGWVKVKNDDGDYYFHEKTGQTSYEPPPRTTVLQ